MQIVNFGGNVKFSPEHIYQPKTEDEVLEDINHLYPNLEKFKKIVSKYNPNGVFRNEYAKEVLGF